MKTVKFVVIILVMLVVMKNGFAQTKGDNRPDSGSIYEPSPPFQGPLDRLQRQIDREIKNDKQTTLYLGRNHPLTNADRKALKEHEKRIKALLTPNSADLTKYKDLLKEPGTGLFRLFPDFDCVQKHVINAGGDCENFIPGTSAYSFRQNDHQSNLGYFDIKLKDSYLVSNGFLSQGILTELGDVALENISLASDGLNFLIGFKPEIESQKVKNQYAQIEKGINYKGFNYTKSLEAKKHTTYALRVVAYRPQRKISNNRRGIDRRFVWLARNERKDERVDLTLVFRIIRKELDGSITIVWKELQRQKSLEIIFSKNERISDISSN